MGMDKPFGKSAISVDEARGMITAEIRCVEDETVSLSEALGRVSAAPVKAAVTSPPFDVSAMDGYAVKAADVSAGMALPLVGVSKTGIRVVRRSSREPACASSPARPCRPEPMPS